MKFLTPDSKVYTYYDSEDLMNPNTCFMMNANGIQSPVLACDHCAIGPGRWLVEDAFHMSRYNSMCPFDASLLTHHTLSKGSCSGAKWVLGEFFLAPHRPLSLLQKPKAKRLNATYFNIFTICRSIPTSQDVLVFSKRF